MNKLSTTENYEYKIILDTNALTYYFIPERINRIERHNQT